MLELNPIPSLLKIAFGQSNRFSLYHSIVGPWDRIGFLMERRPHCYLNLKINVIGSTRIRNFSRKCGNELDVPSL
jgi:hypothetical protein